MTYFHNHNQYGIKKNNFLLQVVLNKLQDEQLAIVIIRLYEGEYEAVPPTLRKQLYTVSTFIYISSPSNICIR